MKNVKIKFFSIVAIVLGICSVTSLIATPVVADENSQIINGITSREPNFFQQGMKQFETEIQRLAKRSQTNQESILKIVPDKSLIQEQLLPLEKPQVLPSQPEKSANE